MQSIKVGLQKRTGKMNIASAMAATYVLESLKIDEAAETKIEIVARRAGLIYWIMAKIFKRISGLVFTVRADGIVLDDGWHQWMPMGKIANIGSGYTMNLLWKILGIVALLAGIYTIRSGGWGLLCVSALLFYLYSSSRRFMLHLTSCSGEGVAFGIKRGAVGGQMLTEEDAARMVELIKKLVIAQ